MRYKTKLSIPISGYVSDPEGGSFTYSATVSTNGGAAVAIPTGIFTWQPTDTIYVSSMSLGDVSTYTISVTVKDS